MKKAEISEISEITKKRGVEKFHLFHLGLRVEGCRLSSIKREIFHLFHLFHLIFASVFTNTKWEIFSL